MYMCIVQVYACERYVSVHCIYVQVPIRLAGYPALALVFEVKWDPGSNFVQDAV